MIHQTVTRVGVRSGHRVTNVCVRGSVLGYLAGRCIGGELRDGVGSRSSGGARGFVGALRIAVAGSGPQQLTRINACRGVGVAGGRTNINPRDRVCGRVCGAGPLPHNAGRCAVEIRQRRFDLRPDLCGWWCQGHRPGLVDVADVDRQNHRVVDRLVGVAGRVFIVAHLIRDHIGGPRLEIDHRAGFDSDLTRHRVDREVLVERRQIRGRIRAGARRYRILQHIGSIKISRGHRLTNVCVLSRVLGYRTRRCISSEHRGGVGGVVRGLAAYVDCVGFGGCVVGGGDERADADGVVCGGEVDGAVGVGGPDACVVCGGWCPDLDGGVGSGGGGSLGCDGERGGGGGDRRAVLEGCGVEGRFEAGCGCGGAVVYGQTGQREVIDLEFVD